MQNLFDSQDAKIIEHSLSVTLTGILKLETDSASGNNVASKVLKEFHGKGLNSKTLNDLLLRIRKAQ